MFQETLYGTFGYWAVGMAITVDMDNNSLVSFIVSDASEHSNKVPMFINLPIMEAKVFKLDKIDSKNGYISTYYYTKNIINNLNITIDSLQKRLTFE